MANDLLVNVEQVGVPLGVMALTSISKEVVYTVVNRLGAFVQVVAYSAAGVSVAFQYCQTTGGTFIRVPAGGGLNLPVSATTQSWFFKEDSSSPASTLQTSCQG